MLFPNRTPEQKSADFLKFLLHFGFLLSGTATVLIGQILPALMLRLSLNDAEAGYFFIAQFSGSITGNFLNGAVDNSFGLKNTTILGLFLMAGGVLGLNSESWVVCLTAFFVTGLGIGITLPSINMLIVELNPLNITPALNFLNFFWGVGAVLCKPFVDFFGTPTSVLAPAAILAALLLPTALAMILTPLPPDSPKSFGKEKAEISTSMPIWTTATAWLIALFNFVHIGFESGMGGWITTYSNRLSNQAFGEINWFSPTFAYFLFFIIGRLTARIYSRLFNENKLLLLSLVVTASGVVILLLGDTLSVLTFAASIAGFGTSAIFPTNMARFAKTFGETASRRATPLFVCGTLGAAFTNWLIGYVSTSYNGLRFGMLVLPASCFILIILQIWLSFKTTK